MDVASVAQVGLSLQSAQTQSQLDVAVARQALDAQKMQGAMALELVQSAQVEPKPAPYGPGQTLHTVA